jgi:hypothetical protein
MRRKGGKGALPIDNILYVAWSSPPMMAGPKIMAAAITTDTPYSSRRRGLRA